MEFDKHDAKVGALLKEKNRAEKRLANRLCWAKKWVRSLRVLADCFDDECNDADVVEVMDNRFKCTHPKVNPHPNRVYKDEDWPEFPPDLNEVVSEICELRAKIAELSGLLKCELDCS